MSESTKSVFISLALSLTVYLIASLYLPSQKSALITIVVLMVSLWTNNGLPLGVVSLFPILLFPAFGILSISSVTANYSNPIIYLFLGGFLVAIAFEKTELHRWLAEKVMRMFPSNTHGIIYSLLFTSALLSAVLSNTTTVLLLLPIAMFITTDLKLKLRYSLSIAYGASIGGILTPIGTPPNLILLGFMQEQGLAAINFTTWVAMTAPLVLIMLIFVGYILGLGIKNTVVTEDINKADLTSNQKKVLALVITLIAVLFLNAPLGSFYAGFGLHETGILLTAGLLLFMPPFSILKWQDDFSKVPFEIIFLFGAGFAIATAFIDTGIAKDIARYLVLFSGLPFIVFMLILAVFITFSTEITSNTALTSIMLPIIYEVSLASGLNTILFMMVATICASYAFMLPIATPPNAIVMSTGVVSIKKMATYGLVFNLAGIVFIVTIATVFWRYVLN